VAGFKSTPTDIQRASSAVFICVSRPSLDSRRRDEWYTRALGATVLMQWPISSGVIDRRPVTKRAPGPRSRLGERSGWAVSWKRAVSTVIVGFLVSEVLATVIHGLLLAGDYAPFEGTLLRATPGLKTPPWQMLFLPVAHLSFIAGLVWLYAHLKIGGSILWRGLTLGIFSWLIAQVPLWLLWYAEQPWPGELVVKQLGLELLSSLIIGIVVALVAGSARSMEGAVARVA